MATHIIRFPGADIHTAKIKSASGDFTSDGNLSLLTNGGGTTNLTATSSGNVGISKTTPAFTLDVNGDINFSGSLYEGGSPFVSTPWTIETGPDALSYTSGNIGINKINPSFTLDVNGDINFTGSLYESGSPFVSTPWTIETGPDALSYTSGNIGIGVVNPAFTLDVGGTANVGALTTTSVSGNGASLTSLNAGNISTGTLGRPVSTTDGTFTGTVSLGSTTRQMLNLYDTSYALGVQSSTLYYRSGGGYAWFKGGVHSGTANDPGTGGVLAMKLDSSYNLTASGDVTAFSDKRVKTDISKIDNALEKVCSINGYTYKRIDTEDEKRHTGVIAQEVVKVLPEVVHGSEETTYSVAYGNMAGLFIEAIKDMKSQLDTAHRRIDELEKRLNV